MSRKLTAIYADSRQRYARLKLSLHSDFHEGLAADYRRCCVHFEALIRKERRREDLQSIMYAIPVSIVIVGAGIFRLKHASILSLTVGFIMVVAATVATIAVGYAVVIADGSRAVSILLFPGLLLCGIATAFLALLSTRSVVVSTNWHPHILHQIAIGSTAGLAVFLTIISSAAGAATLINWYSGVVRYRRYPELVAFSISQELLEWVNGPSSSFDNFADRKRNLDRLEKLAHLFEVGFGSALSFPVEAGSALPFQLVAAHFRGLRAWVALPQAHTRESLRTEFGRTLNALASGQYHYLPRAERLIQIAKPTRSQRLGRLCRNLLIGGLPLIAFAVVELAGVQLGTEIRTTLLLGGVVWAAVTWLTAIDPQSSTRLSTTKDLLGVFTQRKE